MCPAGDNFLQRSQMKSLAEAHDANMDDLVHEVPQAKRLIERKVKEGVAKPTTLTEFLRFINPYKEAFRELFRLCKFAVTIPATSASTERTGFLRSWKNLENPGKIKFPGKSWKSHGKLAKS